MNKTYKIINSKFIVIKNKLDFIENINKIYIKYNQK